MKSTAKSIKPIWDYTSEANGPTNWHTLCDEFCDGIDHKSQSPIKLNKEFTESGRPTTLNFRYHQEIFRKKLDNYTLQLISRAKNNELVVNGQVYSLNNIHFHVPSEHFIENQQTSIEFHLVHSNDKGDLLVLGVLFNISEHQMPNSKNKLMQWYESNRNMAFNPMMFIPENKAHFQYTGSLTTPPTVNNVQWYVFSEIQLLDKRIFTHFRNYLTSEMNSRPVQEKGERKVYYSP